MRTSSTSGSNAASEGSMMAGCSRASATASWVLSPLPVMQRTISSLRGIRPCSINLRATANVTPPAVSAKMPSVRPKSIIASTISESAMSSPQPPLSRMILEAKNPSAGSPMASDLAMVFGLRIGLCVSQSFGPVTVRTDACRFLEVDRHKVTAFQPRCGSIAGYAVAETACRSAADRLDAELADLADRHRAQPLNQGEGSEVDGIVLAPAI